MLYKNDDSAVRRNDDHDDHDGHDDHDDHDEHYEHEDRDDHVCVCMHGRFFGENRCARVLIRKQYLSKKTKRSDAYLE